MEPQQLEVESVNEKGTSASRMYSKYYYETEEKIGFAARVDKGQEVNPMIRAINYKDKLGSTSNFLYSQGNFYRREVDGKEYHQPGNSGIPQ